MAETRSNALPKSGLHPLAISPGCGAEPEPRRKPIPLSARRRVKADKAAAKGKGKGQGKKGKSEDQDEDGTKKGVCSKRRPNSTRLKRDGPSGSSRERC